MNIAFVMTFPVMKLLCQCGLVFDIGLHAVHPLFDHKQLSLRGLAVSGEEREISRPLLAGVILDWSIWLSALVRKNGTDIEVSSYTNMKNVENG